MNPRRGMRIGFGAAGLAVAAAALAQNDAEVFKQYREMMGDDNPAELVVAQGEELWKKPRGPNNVSLEGCDLGVGKGKVKEAYAHLPRYFKDADRVMDLEARLVECMVKLQGFGADDVLAKPFSDQGQPQTDLEVLTAWIAQQSQGVAVDVPQKHAKEKAAFELGKALFAYRAGPYDFSCATCHSQSDKRIRLQSLPNLTQSAGARAAFTTWPGYRISQGTVRTMEWRMTDCVRQQRMPQMKFTSDAAIALITYMGVQAKGAPMAAPGLKR